MKKNKKWIVLIYSIVLTVLAAMMWLVVLINTFTLDLNKDFVEKKDLNLTNIFAKSKISFEQSKFFNSNGSGFIDNISCPENIIMSWSTNIAIISSTNLFIEDFSNFYCKWFYNSDPFKIFFNSSFSDFDRANYKWSEITLISWSWTSNFSDLDRTSMNFSSFNYNVPDWIDDNLDSDNFKENSTWTTVYTNDYFDDDANARTEIISYLKEWEEFYNIFNINSKINKYIKNNLNNSGSIFQLIWDVTDWNIFISSDKNYEIKVYEFDKNKFDENWEFISVLNKSSNLISTNTWFIINSWSWISISDSGTKFSFDFKNKDYGIFIKNSWSWTLTARLKAFSSTWTLLFSNPIDDSWDSLKYFWSNIIFDSEWKMIYKELEIRE